ncbi:STAS domain-containing protein [Nocardia sp. NPDC127579]|uniref:STAS domain-containing protein n=1 Tax=Nocardia sp. NPDC127579 TaxID=3345402 RepID=UPI00362ABE7B
MTTAVAVHDDVTVLSVVGEIDLATAPALETAIEGVLAETPRAVIIDLTGVGFLASAGMAALVAAHKRAGTATTIAVVAEGPATSRQLKMTALDQVFALYATLDEALAALRS